jgi:hypothetical protein
MRDCYRHGIIPLLQMHDCLDCSVGTREQAELIAALGRDAIELSVPMVIDVAFGRSWGNATHTWDELHDAQKVPPSIPTVSPAPMLSAPTPIAVHALFEQEPGGEKRKISCPFHSDSTPSLHVFDDRHWHCFSCQRHGNDIVDLLVIIKGIDRDEADALLQTAPTTPAVDPGETLAAAKLIWDAGMPIRESLAEKYLREVRGININLLPSTDALRFHEDCPFGPGVRYPCLIARFSDVIDDSFAGLHRVALPPAFAGNKVPRMTLGRAFLAALFGLAMSDEQLALYREATGRIVPPSAPSNEAWLVIGRRGGKWFVLAVIAVFLACFRDWRPYLGPGEGDVLVCVAASVSMSLLPVPFSKQSRAA